MSLSLGRIDPRYYQLTVQCGLLLCGWLTLEFVISWQTLLAVLLSGLLVQGLFLRYYDLPMQWLSALNTCLSIILLLNAATWWWLALAAIIAIASKFLLRVQGRHVFNPSNIGIVLVLLATEQTWVAHGKWGQGLWLALLIAGLGLVAMLGWRRMLTSLVFLSTYAALLAGRAIWLGDPPDIPLHQLQNGALLIFCFFMLSDPMTTPQSPKARVLFGICVALIGWSLQYFWFIPNAFLYALACCSPLVPLLNRRFAGARFHWLIRRES